MSQQDIADVFSIFHDGRIAFASQMDDTLNLEIEIRYLAERVNAQFSRFFVTLDGVSDLTFATWPSDLASSPTLLTDWRQIFHPVLDVLEASVVDHGIQVVCNQAAPKFDYCGGELTFKAQAIRVVDEGDRVWSLAELDALCADYWEAFARRAPEDIQP